MYLRKFVHLLLFIFMNDGCLDGNMTSSMVLGETMRSGAHFSQSMYGFLDQIPPPIIAAARALKAHIFLTYWGVTGI